MFGTGGFQKNINVVVGGNASAYIRQIGMATATTKGFKLGVAAAGAAVVALSAVLIGKAVRAAANFEQAMADVRAVTGATGDDFEALMDKAKELGKVTKFTMTDIGAGMEALGRAGFSTQEILGGVEGSAYLAAAGGISLGEAANISSKAIRALGLEASDAMRVADVFAAAAANANVDVTMLGESLKYVAPLARSAGFSLEETVAAIAKLGDVGIQGSMAGTSLRFAFAELLATSDEFKGKLSELGVTLEDITGPGGELLQFSDLLAVLNEAGVSTGQVIELMGKRAGPAITALVQENPALRDFVQMLEDAEGAAKKMADIRLDTLKGQLDILRGSWELFLVEVMSGNDVFKGFLRETLIPWVNKMVEWEEQTGTIKTALKDLFETITGGFEWILNHWRLIAGGIQAIVVAFLALTVAKIVTGIVTLTGAVTGLNVALAATPVGWMAALTALAAYLGTKIPEIYDIVVGQFGEGFNELTRGAETAQKVTQKMVDFLEQSTGEAADSILTNVIATESEMESLAEDLAQAQSEAIASLEAGTRLDAVVNAFDGAVREILAKHDILQEGVEKTYRNILETAVATWRELTGVEAGGFVEGMVSAARESAEQMRQLIADWRAAQAGVDAGGTPGAIAAAIMANEAEALKAQLESLTAEFGAMLNPTQDVIQQLADLAKAAERHPEIYTAIYDILQKSLTEQEALLAAQKALDIATGDTENAITYLKIALGMTESAADTAASSLFDAAGAASSLADALRAQTISQAGSILGTIDEMIATIQSGTQRTVEQVECPGGICPVDGQAMLTLDDTTGALVNETELTIGAVVDLTSEISGATGVISALRESLWGLGLGSSAVGQQVEQLYQQMQGYTEGMNPEKLLAEQQRAANEAQRAADEAKRQAEDVQREAQQQAEEAQRLAEQAAKDAAEALRSGFESKFTEPIARALATGDWMAAAKSVQAMARSFPELSQEAAAVSESLRAVGMEGISQVDVLRELTSMESGLASVLEDRMRLAELAGDFELVESLQQMKDAIDEMFSPEEVKTWKEKASEWLDKGWSSVIDALVAILPGKIGDLASTAVNAFTAALTNPLQALAYAIQFFVQFIDLLVTASQERLLAQLEEQRDALEEEKRLLEEQRDILQDQLSELSSAFDFYVDSLNRAGTVMDKIFSNFGPLGSVASVTMQAFIDSVKMLNLHGIDLLNQGMLMLTNFVSGLVDVVNNLIKRSDAYQAVQDESSRAWKAVSDLLGQFLWPLAALIKHILDWLGIQQDVNTAAEEALAEVGVPRIWKREFRRWQAAAPGEIVTGGGPGEVEIPEWATAIVEGLAEAIEGLLERYGITSWADLLERFRAGSERFWNYVNAHIPQLIAALGSIFSTIQNAIGGGIIDGIVRLMVRGFDWLINDAPTVVKNAVDFIGDVFDLLGDVWDWFEEQDWGEILGKIREKFDEFSETLEELETLTDIVTAIDGVTAELNDIETAIDEVASELDDVETAINDVESAIDSMKRGIVMAIAVVGGAITGALVAPIGLKWAGALLGAALGGIGAYIWQNIRGFQQGGIVPGRIGEPVLGLLHGQEEVLSYQQREQRGQAIIVENHNHFYVDGREVAFAAVDRTQHISKFQTGSKNSLAAQTRRTR